MRRESSCFGYGGEEAFLSHAQDLSDQVLFNDVDNFKIERANGWAVQVAVLPIISGILPATHVVFPVAVHPLTFALSITNSIISALEPFATFRSLPALAS
jgi:hypothetical protein